MQPDVLMSKPHQLDRSILREYDIRGIVGKTLSAADARAVGRGFGTQIRRAGGKAACVGYDGRLSSPELEQALVEGLNAAGVDAWRVGRGPTPMLYFATRSFGADGGIMVTGSHNPPDHNGFKMMLGKASFFGEDIQKLGRLLETGDLESGAGKAEDRPAFAAYVDRLARDYAGERKLAVAWDAGNGAAGEAIAALTQKLPGTHHLMFVEIDGRFPNHHPDPTEEKNLADLKRTVREKGCDVGLAFDGDGDRLGAVDGRGRVLWADQIMMLFAEDVLATKPGATIISDVKASQVLFDHIKAKGGKPLMYRTGHSLIKSKMAETGAPLAGEMSGHIFFADRYYGFDDALYAAVRLLSILARRKQSLAEFRDALPAVVNTPELRFACAEERKFKLVDEVRDRLAAARADVNGIDGVRVRTSDGWWLLRASNTQAVLVARCEAKNEAGLGRLKAQLAEQLEKSGLRPPAF
ncbi:MAG: phosphomannomutase/phosphoglucomutase [Alphaproteobacteria bacterium]|nr:phosphomannomutase/phosphoglucomutase [Alphaproteobacteria bacterium]